MKSSNPDNVVQRGLPPYPRLAIRRAHWQPRTNVSDVNRGSPQQPRTEVLQHTNRGQTPPPITKRSILNICTYNTRTVNDLNTDARAIMLEELKDIKWDVVGMSETKMKDSDIQTIEESGDRIYFSGNNVSRSNGVGFLVKKYLIPNVEVYDPISDRLAVLTLKGKFANFVLVQCYFPTLQHPDDEVDELYDKVQEIISNVPKRDHLIIMGDFNSKVGGLNDTFPSAIGKHTIGKYNVRGVRLATFCTHNNLVVTNTCFKKRRHYTWTSPDGKTKNQIDFILVRKSCRHNVTNCSALNVPDISDHRMVRATLKLKFSWPKKKTIDPRYDIDQLNDHNTKQKYNLELHNRFSVLSLDKQEDVEPLSSEITSAINETISKVLPKKKSYQPPWVSNNTKAAIENKHKTRKQFGANSAQYKTAKAETKKLTKKDKLKQIEDDHDSLSSLPPHKQFYAAVKKLKAKPKSISWGIKDKHGKILTNRTEILERWAEFYEELYNDTYIPTPVDDSTEDNIPPITHEEIRNAIKLLKPGKSPGIDKIHSEYLQAGGEHIVSALYNLFNNILYFNNIPLSFRQALIVIILKKDSQLDCKNYRPISLLSHIYKLFISIIASRVKSDLYASFPQSQAAYQPNRGTIEQIISIEQIIEKSIEFNNPVHIVFIDFTKAFDSIKLSCLWKLLDKTNINKKYINLLQNTYDESKSAIKTDIGITRFINIMKGVKQGDILAALLFCIVVASIILKTEEECDTGYPIGGQIISNLSYADDIAAMSHDSHKLQEYVNILARHAEEVGLYINVSKTNCMSTAKVNKTLNITVYNKPVKQVDNFIYLGHKISSVNDNNIPVQHRIGLGWAAFGKHKHLLTSSRIPYHIKRKIYNTYILPVVLYGLDCITWNNTLSKKIESFQNHIMRFITGYKLLDKVRIDTLRQLTKIPPIMPTIKSRTLKLFGHIKRSTSGFSKICLEGMTVGTRSVGRPRRRWMDNVFDWAELDLSSLNKVTQDRVLWRAISHVGAHSAAGGDSE